MTASGFSITVAWKYTDPCKKQQQTNKAPESGTAKKLSSYKTLLE
jgi:hypothetical protein